MSTDVKRGELSLFSRSPT